MSTLKKIIITMCVVIFIPVTAIMADPDNPVSFSTVVVQGLREMMADDGRIYTLSLSNDTSPTDGQALTWNTGDTVTWEDSGAGGSGDVTAASNIPANAVVIGDDGAKGVLGTSALTFNATDGLQVDVNGKYIRFDHTGSTATIITEFGTQMLVQFSNNLEFNLANDMGAGNVYSFKSAASAELTDTDAEQAWMYAAPKINQTDTGWYVGFLMDVEENQLGSGQSYLMDLRVGGNSIFGITNTGTGILVPQAAPTIDADGKFAIEIDGWATDHDAWRFWDGTSSLYTIATTNLGNTGEVPKKNADGTVSFQAVAGSGDVTAASNLGDNLLIRGDGAGKGVQNTGISIDDSDAMTGVTINSSTNDVHADSIHELLRNESGDTINRGDAVYISGYSVGQDLALVTLADADSGATMPSVALVEDSSIANNGTGEFVEVGTLSGFDTSAWSVGDQLYISGTGTTGNTLTNTKPTGTALIQKVAEVLRSHASLGVVEVFGAGRANDLPNIADTKVWIGDTNGVPQEFALSGDVAMDAGGVITIGANAIDSDSYVDGSIDLEHMSSQSVDSDNIVEDTIVDADINSAAAISVSKTALVAGRSLTLSTDIINSDAETYIYKAKIAFENPVAGDDFFFDELQESVTFTSIYAKTLVGTVDFDITIAGSGINGSDITATTGGVLDSSLAGDTTGVAGEEIKLEITSVASVPTYIMIILTGTYDD